MIELIVVLAIAGMIAGLVVTGIGRSGESARQRRAVEGLASELLGARIDAMRSASAQRLIVRWNERELVSQTADRTRAWLSEGLVPLDEYGETLAELVAEYDGAGRTTQRTWRFGVPATPQGTIWIIEFDPVSGVVRSRRAPDEWSSPQQ